MLITLSNMDILSENGIVEVELKRKVAVGVRTVSKD